MNRAYLLIGGNMGDRGAYLSAARKQVAKNCGLIVNESSVYQTAAWGLEDQDAFLNQVLEISTSLDPLPLLHQVLAIEESLGRRREQKYGPRIIDIDILLFNQDLISVEGLTLPHPQMQNRRFVLEPLNEIASEVIHPVFNKSIARLLEECPDKLAVQKFQ